MNKEKDFFKTCFNIVAGLEVTNEDQAIAKEVVLNEIEHLQQENKQLKDNWNKLKEDLKLVIDYGSGDEASKWDKTYKDYAKSTLKFMQELEQGIDSNE